jgi:hypothetical protein
MKPSGVPPNTGNTTPPLQKEKKRQKERRQKGRERFKDKERFDSKANE